MKQRLKLAETTNAKLQRDETSTSTPPQVMNFSAAGTEERLLKLEDEQSRLTSKQLLTTVKILKCQLMLHFCRQNWMI